MRIFLLIAFGTLALGQSTTEPSSTVVTSTTTSRELSSTPTQETTTTDNIVVTTQKKSLKTTSTESSSTSSSPPSSTGSFSTTSTMPPQTTTEWQDMNDMESEKLVNFVVAEIQKLKMEHKELDDCQELNLSSVLSGKKLEGKSTKYSITLKVQPQVKNTTECLKQNSTMTNMHPEICEADVVDDDHGVTEGKTLLRSTCLQVEELQD